MDRDFDTALKSVAPAEPPRVWSFLVTIFGDLAQAEDRMLSGATLQAICDPLDLKPEAVRVALHRLRKDGWIESRKRGRESRHGLSSLGRRESRAASPRIYALSPDDGPVFLWLTDPASPPAPEGLVPVLPNVHLARHGASGRNILCQPVDRDRGVPHWMAERICPPELRAASADLARRLDRLRAHLARMPEPTPLQSAVLRVIALHDWRRIALRAPDLPDWAMPPDWCGATCRETLSDVLSRLPAPDPAALEPHVPLGRERALR